MLTKVCSGDTPLKVSISSTNIFYVAMHKTMLGGLKIRVTSIDAANGQEQRQQMLSSDNEVNSSDDVLFVGSNSALPVVIWTDKSRNTLKMNILGTNGLSVFQTDSRDQIDRITVHAPTRLMSKPHFLIAYEAGDTSWAEVYRIEPDREQVFKGYDLPKRGGKGSFATGSYGADVYFTRVVKGGIEVYASPSETAVARYIMADFGVPGLQDYPEPVHVVSEVMPRVGTSPAVRAAFLLASGDWVLNLNGEFAWSRPEALAAPSSAVIADLPLKGSLAQELATEAHSNLVAAYVHRLKRHVKDLEQLPDLVRKILDLIIGSMTGRGKDSSGMSVKSDSYGFRKLAIVATKNGRLIAIDTGRHGAVAWNIPQPDYAADLKWQSIQLDTSPNGIGRMKTEDGSFQFNVTTGKFLAEGTASPSKRPSGPKVRIQYALIDDELKGYFENDSSSPVWTFRPAPGETITAITARPAHDPVASIGKVLGDRSVLYKYLNPNAILVTATDERSASLSIYLLDTVSGALLSEAHHGGVDISRPIPAVISENWFCYSFTSDSSATASKGPQIVISELYESAMPNDRGALGASNNYSALQPSVAGDFKPYLISQSYQIPEEISDMTVSQTRQGITTKLLLAVLPEGNSIIGIPRTALDPRRTVGRDPTSSEQTEGLTRYQPVLDFDPKWYLNHKREVHGVKCILSSPSVLESTSLVFAYGFDIFGTRISPSFSFDILGKEFNKVQMLITVAALAVGVLFVAPLVSAMFLPFRKTKRPNLMTGPTKADQYAMADWYIIN